MHFNFVFWISCGLFPHNKELTLSHVNLVCAVLSCSVPSDSLQPHGLWPARLPYPWGFSREEYWSALPLLLPGIFLTQGLNPHVPHCEQILYHLSHQQRPRILEWVTLSLLQGIFITQESSWGFLRCRQILYQLSYQGSSNLVYMCIKV